MVFFLLHHPLMLREASGIRLLCYELRGLKCLNENQCQGDGLESAGLPVLSVTLGLLPW